MPSALGAGGVQLGDTEADVLNALGEPQGRLKAGPQVILNFRRGVVVLREGRVVAMDVVTDEEAAQKAENRARATVARRAHAEQDRLRRIEEGTAERERRLADEEFAKLPPAERLAFWTGFRKRYPGVPVDDVLAAAEREVAILDGQQREKERQAIQTRAAKLREEIEERSLRHGQSRSALMDNRRQLDRLRQELAELEVQLGGGAQPVPPPSP